MTRPAGSAVVTGASSGIGTALARRLAGQGYDLVLVARRADRLAALAAELRETYRVAVDVRPVDLADRAARGALATELTERDIAVLCANAGFSSCGHLRDHDPAQLAREVEVNVVAVHELTTAVLPGMLARDRGGILVTGSTAGEQPVPMAATYGATKAFLNSFTQALHEELRGTGVRCTLLAPGPVRTELYDVAGVPGIRKHRWLRWLTADQVAAAGLAGLAAGRRAVVPGVVAKAQAWSGRHLPRWLLFPAMRQSVLPLLVPADRRPEPRDSVLS
ncbi:hypothetical protein GA0074692_0102 [Micromonospora pallida]|uniref:Short-chain dehydrogenase n=1 Tax=Micromonospora pallida TaxID=145854 RepID=A0A1C6RJF9_9ACTN|nr:SDR family NAD(P)-dependent oxidoreductase [Micromonospora pallida]SCL17155.1 hypothetical protein GA0074692_0102 [Micromonospora pallida]